MPRLAELDLTAPAQPWRQVPMEGANLGLDVVPLESPPGALTMLARFPAGFARLTPGGYAAAEEFLVLDGELEFEGIRHGRGSLAFIPARFLRTSLVSPGGCTVLAWWGGPAQFVLADSLADPVRDGRVQVDLASTVPGLVLSAGAARWTQHAADDEVPGAHGDVIDVALTRWYRTTAQTPQPGAPFLLRTNPAVAGPSREDVQP